MSLLKAGRRFLLGLFFSCAEAAFAAATLFYLLRKDARLYIFDIDNTLADTWPSFLTGYDSETTRLKTLSIFVNMRKWLLEISSNPKNKVVFLSARRPVHYFATISWLRGNRLPANFWNVFIVNQADDKLKLLTRIKKSCKRVYYIDDLSYARETGRVLFYNAMIAGVKELGVNYMGYEEIRTLIQGEGKH